MHRPKHLLLAGALVLSACRPASDATTTSTLSQPATSPSVATTTPAPTTTLGSTTTTSAPVSMTTLPGEGIDFGPIAGDQLMVIGVSHDEFLNLRELPGTSFGVVDTIPPDHRDLIASGNTRDLGTAFWIEVDYEGTVGWVHMGFVGYEGRTDDMTAFVIDQLGERPSADSLAELGLAVAAVLASDDPASDLVMVAPESVDDVGLVTHDVIGLGDDAVRGLRVLVIAEAFEGGFTLRTAEVTTICGRGVTADGLCT